MPAGEAFSERQEREISRALRQVSTDTGANFSVFVGQPDRDLRSYAQAAHAALGPDLARESVLIFIAPEQRRVEIVTGSGLRNRVTDRDCALAALSMSSSFAGGDLAGGILTGIRMLAQHAGRKRPVSRL